MIKIENTDVYGFQAAIRGMRNPKNSWDKSDSLFDGKNIFGELKTEEGTPLTGLGKNDVQLMKTLSDAGNDHGKFLRMIHVSVDVTAPLYWWKEADQYKVGTTTDSCSTMHKIHAKEFTLDDFSHEHLDDTYLETVVPSESCYGLNTSEDVLKIIISALNDAREQFLKHNDKKYWWYMIQLLPSSYNQKRTWDLNYAVLKNIYHARKNHKLDEWHDLCSWIESLPYSKLIMGD